MKITIDLNELQNEDGTWNQKVAEVVSQGTGLSFQEAIKQAEGNKADTPEGDPRSWSLTKKNEYIDQHGRDGWKQLLAQHK